MAKPWVKILIESEEYLPKDRPYSLVEAEFHFGVDQFKGKQRTTNEYSKIWSWSRGKVTRFIDKMTDPSEPLLTSINEQNGEHKTDTLSTQCEHNISNTNKDLTPHMSISRTPNEQQADTVYIRENRENKNICPKSLFNSWNEAVIATPLPAARSFSSARERKCLARLKNRALEEWKEIFHKMTESTFMCSGKWADFDWIIKNDENAAKVIEGKYDNTGGRSANTENRYSMFAGA